MSKFLKWIPALIMMAVIYISSATPSNKIPNYGIWDMLVKKGGHMIGYAILSVTYWYGFGFKRNRGWLGWILAVLYAASDEFHQSFTPGRHPSLVDVFLFDGGGSAVGLTALAVWFKLHRPGQVQRKPF